MLTAKSLKRVLSYDPDTGILTWLMALRKGRSGCRAGWRRSITGYRAITIDGETFPEHRLVWLYMTGKWPLTEIDHKNLIIDDNRWSNLREATRSQNKYNRTKQSNNRIGLKGVSSHRNKWRAVIQVNGKQKNLGSFATKEMAYAAYCKAAEMIHQQYVRF